MPDIADHTIEKTLLWVGGLAMGLAFAVGAWVAWALATGSARPSAANAVIVASRPAQAVTDHAARASEPPDLRQFALNALLAPLIDDGVPPRWTDVALDFMCDPGTRVLIDGQPMVPGDPVPTRPFSVRWDTSHCEPFGPALSISGSVELRVTHEPSGMSAVVFPQRLRLHGAAGSSGIRDSFGARLSFVAIPGEP